MEQQSSWYLSRSETALEVLFLSLLTFAMGAGMQVALLSTLLAIFGPLCALRGPDGSIHTAVQGMRQWTRGVLVRRADTILLLCASSVLKALLPCARPVPRVVRVWARELVCRSMGSPQQASWHHWSACLGMRRRSSCSRSSSCS